MCGVVPILNSFRGDSHSQFPLGSFPIPSGVIPNSQSHSQSHFPPALTEKGHPAAQGLHEGNPQRQPQPAEPGGDHRVQRDPGVSAGREPWEMGGAWGVSEGNSVFFEGKLSFFEGNL